MGEGDTLVNALIGAVVGLLLFFLPFSPALGGGVAGYLQNRGTRDGVTVGALSGLFAAIPGAVVLTVFLGFFAVVGVTAPRAGLLGFGFLFLLVALAVAAYTVLLGALGGAVGGFVREEYDAPPPGELLGSSDRDTTDTTQSTLTDTDTGTTDEPATTGDTNTGETDRESSR